MEDPPNLERVTAEELILLQAFRRTVQSEYRRNILEFAIIQAQRAIAKNPKNLIVLADHRR